MLNLCPIKELCKNREGKYSTTLEFLTENFSKSFKISAEVEGDFVSKNLFQKEKNESRATIEKLLFCRSLGEDDKLMIESSLDTQKQFDKIDLGFLNFLVIFCYRKWLNFWLNG